MQRSMPTNRGGGGPQGTDGFTKCYYMDPAPRLIFMKEIGSVLPPGMGAGVDSYGPWSALWIFENQ